MCQLKTLRTKMYYENATSTRIKFLSYVLIFPLISCHNVQGKLKNVNAFGTVH